MGTTVSISAIGEQRGQLMDATNEAFAELYRLDRLLSVFIPSSDISRLNRAEADDPVPVEADTFDLLERSGRFTEMTGGSFDVTVGALMSRWGFHGDSREVRDVSVAELADAKEGIGWRHVRLDRTGTVRRARRSTQIDLGGIGAGFAVDRMGEVLRRHGVEAALIDHSGDLLAVGAPPETEGWSVAIPDPVGSEDLMVRLHLRDQALSTSTNLRTTRRVAGRTVGHILRPQTGENPRHALSVSVLAPTSLEADALSTALFVDPSPEGAWRNGQREAIMVRGDGGERAVKRLR